MPFVFRQILVPPRVLPPVNWSKADRRRLGRDFHTAFFVLVHGYGLIFKIYELYKLCEQEKRLAKTLQKFDKPFDNTR